MSRPFVDPDNSDGSWMKPPPEPIEKFALPLCIAPCDIPEGTIASFSRDLNGNLFISGAVKDGKVIWPLSQGFI